MMLRRLEVQAVEMRAFGATDTLGAGDSSPIQQEHVSTGPLTWTQAPNIQDYGCRNIWYIEYQRHCSFKTAFNLPSWLLFYVFNFAASGYYEVRSEASLYPLTRAQKSFTAVIPSPWTLQLIFSVSPESPESVLGKTQPPTTSNQNSYGT